MSAVSDKEFYNMTISMNKALNLMEAPLKIKHARSIIIATHRTKEGNSFWAVAKRQPLMENRFTAWKFCHLLHKVLREGHQSTLKHSQTHKKLILEMGKLWGHLQDGVGELIQSYSKLIVTKLDFHDKNSIFPGSLTIEFRDIEDYAGDDINIYFQMCVEIFDYLDEIIALQWKIFAAVNTYRTSSMTPQGQCRLAPLITLIQDSNPLYDLSVRLLFKLHDKLSNEVLSGHRSRFRILFIKLKDFYDNVRPLHYFKDLISVPQLPETAPDFCSKVDFGSYIPPVFYVQPEPEPIVDNLIDTCVTEEPEERISNPSMQDHLALQNALQEKEDIIYALRSELFTARESKQSIDQRYRTEQTQLRDEIAALRNEVTYCRELNQSLDRLKNELETKLERVPNIMEKATQDEEKAKVSEEKFIKLKTMYAQIRDEHINLLRQHGESSKLLNREKDQKQELDTEIKHLKEKIAEFESNANKEIIILNENSKLNENLNEITQRYETLLSTHKSTIQDLNNEKNAEKKRLDVVESGLMEKVKELQERDQHIMDLQKSLKKAQVDLKMETEMREEITKRFNEDLCAKEKSISDLNKNCETDIKSKEKIILEMQKKNSKIETDLEEKILSLTRIKEEKFAIESEVQDLLQQNAVLEKRLCASQDEVSVATRTINDNIKNHQQLLLTLLQNMFLAGERVFNSKMDELVDPSLENALQLSTDAKQLIEQLNVAYQKYSEDNSSVKELAKSSILLPHLLSLLYIECNLMSNTTTDLEKVQDICASVRNMREPFQNMYRLLYDISDVKSVDNCSRELSSKINLITKSINELLATKITSADLDCLVENELQEMDKAIREATDKFAELLSSAKTKDDGIKLEVNEKILDSCTSLMECIKILIKRSKVLQDEIVAAGRGNASIKEFYKRNSQWTEGLISAAKSVAKGANLLVDAANNAVNGESNKNLEIIVAAQEIAACTAQLVIASKVKSPKGSQKLTDLTKASRSVSEATGVVIATVKDCNRDLELSQEVDLTKLTASQVKTMEMEIHLKVLELEHALQTERYKLSSFRKNQYHLID